MQADTLQSAAVACFTLALAFPLARTTGLMLLQVLSRMQAMAACFFLVPHTHCSYPISADRP